MADRFIDQDETQIYGPYASKRIREKLIGLIPEYDTALTYIADQIDAQTELVRTTVDTARAQDAARKQGSQDKAPILVEARRLLGQFSKHLSTHDETTIHRKVYFVKDGTAGGVGRSAPDVLLAITQIATKLKDPKSPVREAPYWQARFDTMMKTLGPVVEFADDARIDRESTTPEVEAARQGWLTSYLAAKSLIESLLRQLGRLEQLSLYFYDLRVPANTKVREMPPEE